jgi:predicted metal-dependent phosphoesterase TrpH
MTVDLHLHTNHSDGTWSPSDLIDYALKLKLRSIAITDHDTVSAIPEGITYAAGRLEIIPAVEINTRAESSQKRQDIHILGYFIDIHNPQLNALLNEQKQARIEHVAKVIEKLNNLGIKISLESIRRFTEGGPIGQAHITKAIVEAGGAKDITEAYGKFMSKTSGHYIKRESVTPKEAIESIKNAGGISSLAHPGEEEQALATLDELIPLGLDAVEIYHPTHSNQTVRQLIRFAKKRELLMTGGSDCHGPYENCPPSIGSINVPAVFIRHLKCRSNSHLLAIT